MKVTRYFVTRAGGTATPSHQPPSSRGSMSYTAHHRSHQGACSPRRVGAGSGPAATPGCDQRSGRDHRPHTRPPPCRLPNWARPNPKQPSWCSAWRGPRTLLACPRSSPSPVDAATMARPDDAQTWCPAPRPSTAARSGGRTMTWWAGTAAGAGTNSPRPRHDARNSVPGPRRAGPQGHGGVSVAVPEPFPPEARSHHDQLTEQPFA
jgi:hypothetical protein